MQLIKSILALESGSREPVVHKFSDTGMAYDACQMDQNIKNGDVLLIEPEKVVGVAETWPFAVTKEYGHLHGIQAGVGLHKFANAAVEFSSNKLKAALEILEGIDAAQKLAIKMGYPLHEFADEVEESATIKEGRVKEAMFDLIEKASKLVDGEGTEYTKAVVAKVIEMDRGELFGGDVTSCEEMVKNVLGLDEGGDSLDMFLPDRSADKALGNLARSIEDRLPHTCRYKSFDFDRRSKTMYWVTQEGTPPEMREAAETIQAELTRRGFTGWTVKIISRDEYDSDTNNNPWITVEPGLGAK